MNQRGHEGRPDAATIESLGRLAGLIAHDFNNMLFAIRGYTDLLIEDLRSSDNPELRAMLPNAEAIREAADRASALTGRLTAYSRDPGPDLPDLSGDAAGSQGD